MVNSDKIMIMICARISFFYYARILDSRPHADVKIIGVKLYPLVYVGVKKLNQLRNPLENDLSRGLSH